MRDGLKELKAKGGENLSVLIRVSEIHTLQLQTISRRQVASCSCAGG